MRKQKGLNIVETMLLLLVLGFAGAYAVDALIDYRCKTNPAQQLCDDENAPRPVVPQSGTR